MNLRKALVPIAGLALIALVVSVAGPPTVHAVSAALVLVTNTAANPAGTQDISTTASQIVELRCSSSECLQVFSDGSTASVGNSYFVPVGKNLVITSLDILPNPVGPVAFPVFANLVEVQGGSSNYINREKWAIQTVTSTVLQFPAAGIVIAANSFPFVQFNFANNSTLGLDNYSATLHGYLTSN